MLTCFWFGFTVTGSAWIGFRFPNIIRFVLYIAVEIGGYQPDSARNQVDLSLTP